MFRGWGDISLPNALFRRRPGRIEDRSELQGGLRRSGRFRVSQPGHSSFERGTTAEYRASDPELPERHRTRQLPCK